MGAIQTNQICMLCGFAKGLAARSKKVVYSDKFSVITSPFLQERLVCRDLTNFAEAEKSSNAPSTKFVPGKSRTKIDLINKTVITCRSYVVKAIAMEQKEVDCFAKLCWPVFRTDQALM